ncbi:MAG: hypothetical protein AB7P03_13075 [Kofleriaceae bacterium]
MSTVEAHPAIPELGTLTLALAGLGPVAIGALLATQTRSVELVLIVPAMVFGVVAATTPALYIATAATGAAPPIGRVGRAFGAALGAFGVALVGLILPAAFLSLSSSSRTTTFVAASAALGSAAILGCWRLERELAAGAPAKPMVSRLVFWVWAAATIGIAQGFWRELVTEVMS